MHPSFATCFKAAVSCRRTEHSPGGRMAGRYVLKKSGDQFYFNLKAGNNEVILTSERYTAKASALVGIEAVKTNAPLEARYERRTSSSDEPYFVLKGGNHEVLGTSEFYSSSSARDAGVAAVRATAPAAPLDDQTRAER
jgi:uncharacterized protein